MNIETALADAALQAAKWGHHLSEFTPRYHLFSDGVENHQPMYASAYCLVCGVTVFANDDGTIEISHNAPCSATEGKR